MLAPNGIAQILPTMPSVPVKRFGGIQNEQEAMKCGEWDMIIR